MKKAGLVVRINGRVVNRTGRCRSGWVPWPQKQKHRQYARKITRPDVQYSEQLRVETDPAYARAKMRRW